MKQQLPEDSSDRRKRMLINLKIMQSQYEILHFENDDLDEKEAD